MLSVFDLIAALLVVAAVFGWLNKKLIGLPQNIGLLAIGLVSSLALIGIDLAYPQTEIYETVIKTITQIDFYDTVMNGMLAFLLFAGALHVNFARLRKRAASVAILASLGVFITMAIVAFGFWAALNAIGVPIGLAWCFVFGAIVAPTDPVAVLATLKALDTPPALEDDMTGEALFNDGIGVVAFAIALKVAYSGADFGLAEVGKLLVLEAGGGAVLGLVTGYIAFLALRSLDDYATEVLISLALVMGTYALAHVLHISGPIAVVVAGVFIGNRGAAQAMSETTRRYMFGFWELTDEILNALLFMLIGLEVLIIAFSPQLAIVGLIAIPIMLVARIVAVSSAVGLLARWHHFVRGTIPVLTWGGIRGGISVALALSLPAVSARPLILAATYGVVIFSVIVQGLTLPAIMRRTIPNDT